MLSLSINVEIIIFVSFILKRYVTYNYLRCCKIPKGYNSSSSNINDYLNVVEITSTQHYTR